MTAEYIHFYNSPIGVIRIEAAKDSLKSVKFDRSLSDFPADSVSAKPESEIIKQAIDWLDAYFNKKELPQLPDLKLPDSDLQRRIHFSLLKTRIGETLSYSELAERIGLESKAARAVGTALSKNPFHILIPCHRVINKDGSIGNYAAGSKCKAALLELEKLRVNEVSLKEEREKGRSGLCDGFY